MSKVQHEGFLRLDQIVRVPKKKKGPSEPLFPISRATWERGLRKGIYPQPVSLGCRTRLWRSSDIAQLIANGVKE